MSKKEVRIYLTVEEAIDLLPDSESIHTFINCAFGLIGADWSHEDLVEKISVVDYREVTGKTARGMNHGLALWNDGCMQSDILFVETDMKKLNALYPGGNDDA